MRFLKELIENLSGNKKYQKYLDHFVNHHSNQKPLSKKDFFMKIEQEKWNKINRCC